MPCTRTSNEPLMDCDLPSDSDDDYDPDYCEDPDEDDELPQTKERDRAQWIVDYHEELAEMFSEFRNHGRALFGDAFFQNANITTFSKFVYINTTP